MVIFVLKEKINLNDIGLESFCCLRPKVKQPLSLKPLIDRHGLCSGRLAEQTLEVSNDQP